MKYRGKKYSTTEEIEMAVLKQIQVHLMNIQVDVYEHLFPLGGVDPRSPLGAKILAKDGTELNDFEYHFLETKAAEILAKMIRKLDDKTGLIITAQMKELDDNDK